jgi:PAS domain S-box-containing protein
MTHNSVSNPDSEVKLAGTDSAAGDPELTAAKLHAAELAEVERKYSTLLEELYLHQEELRTQNEELRYAQISLENARRRHQDLFDFSPVAQFLVSPNGMIFKTNRVAACLLGLDSSELYNYHMPNLATGSSQRVSILSFLDAVANHKAPVPIKVDLFCRDGSSIRVQLHGSRSGAHQETSILLTAVDVSGQYELEQERAQRLEAVLLCNALLSYCDNAVFVTDEFWRVQRVNPAFTAITHYQEHELKGEKLEVFAFWDAGLAENWLALSKLKAQGHWEGLVSIKDKQGLLVDVHLKMNAISNNHGVVSAYLGVILN